jgi:hypothetical protein
MSTQESLVEILKEIQIGIQSIAAIYNEVSTSEEQNEKKNEKFENRKNIERHEEKRVLELLKKKYMITRHPKDFVIVSELTRFLILDSDEFTPRKYDKILGRLFKSHTKKIDNKNVKIKVGIKIIE